MIDVVDTPLDVEDDTLLGFTYGDGHDNIWGLGNSAADAEIRARRALKQSYKSDKTAATQQAQLAKIKADSTAATNSGNTGTGNPAGVPNPIVNVAPIDPIAPNDSTEEDNTLMYLGIGAGTLIVIGIVIFVIIKMRG